MDLGIAQLSPATPLADDDSVALLPRKRDPDVGRVRNNQESCRVCIGLPWPGRHYGSHDVLGVPLGCVWRALPCTSSRRAIRIAVGIHVLRGMIMEYGRLWAQRKLRGWSQEDVVRRLIDVGIELGERQLGITRSQVSRWERGVTHPRAPY